MGFAMRSRVESRPHIPIGIDLGNSYSRVSMVKEGDVIVIPNSRGRLATPSVVAFAKEGMLVGDAALEQAASNPDNTVFAPQRLLGAKFESRVVQIYSKSCSLKIVRGSHGRAEIRVRDGGTDRQMAPEELVTMLLQYLKRMAERYLGCRVSQVVVTIPAQLGHNQRTVLIEACRDARMQVSALLKAPTAAAVAFAQTNPTRNGRSILVCDMGSRYFDFCLLTIEDGVLQERAAGTDYVDLEDVLLRFCLKDLKHRFSVDLAHQQGPMQRLREACEMAKRELSRVTYACVEVKGLVASVDYTVSISRSFFEDCTYKDLESMLEPIDYCLEDCGLGRDDVDVVLVGGSARIPQVRRVIRTFFYGRAPCEVLRPEHAAVLGAGVYAALLSCVSKPSPLSRSSSCGGRSIIESGGSALEGAHHGLRRLRVGEVMPWCTVPTSDSDSTNDATGGDRGHSNGCDSASTVPRSSAREEPPSLASDEMESAPCNEAAGFPQHRSIALRRASGSHRASLMSSNAQRVVENSLVSM
jgi:molecular chaperone DnaK (HSP70)